METGTLTQLNVQPGDVVAMVYGSPGYEDYCRKFEGVSYTVGPLGGATSQEPGAGGGWAANCPHTFRIISRATPQPDLTAITTPFGLLDAATQEALRAHGGPYEMLRGVNHLEWREVDDSADLWKVSLTYRLQRPPKVEKAMQDRWLDEDGDLFILEHPQRTPVRVTFNRIDGVIDLSSYRLEAR